MVTQYSFGQNDLSTSSVHEGSVGPISCTQLRTLSIRHQMKNGQSFSVSVSVSVSLSVSASASASVSVSPFFS